MQKNLITLSSDTRYLEERSLFFGIVNVKVNGNEDLGEANKNHFSTQIGGRENLQQDKFQKTNDMAHSHQQELQTKNGTNLSKLKVNTYK